MLLKKSVRNDYRKVKRPSIAYGNAMKIVPGGNSRLTYVVHEMYSGLIRGKAFL